MVTKPYTMEKLHAIMQASPLFHNLTQEDRLYLTGSQETEFTVDVFSSGEEIPSVQNGERRLILILEGNGIIYSLNDDHSVILKTIGPSDVFGVSILFSDEPPVSVVRAKGTLTALCLSASTILGLLDRNADFRMRYISFLSSRICFLNRRIASYTAGSAERRLAIYLSTLPMDENGSIRIDLSMTALAAHLDVSRASLYRALDRLSKEGLLLHDGRSIRIPDRNALSSYKPAGSTTEH